MSTTSESRASTARSRDKVSIFWLILAFAGGPLAWTAQLLIGYPIASYACYPRAHPVHELAPGWGGAPVILAVLQLLAVLAALSSAGLAWRIWKRSRRQGEAEAPGPLQEGEGRTRFIAMSGVVTGIGFTIAILFCSIALIGVPACRG